ncbi:hypothetical protein [Winogradskyella vidalii]|uniref:hypothetical protein n=1 Tax=Winogradskyella vidalii TaxID=2615024 RepID=UPI0015CCE6C9|nr:hypothetical protein [Winogradskyella vidalii]
MKKFALLSILFISVFTSCNLDDVDNNNYLGTEVLPIESVEMPEYFVIGETYEILITYERPSNCYQFYTFLYDIHENERTVAVVNAVYANDACVEETESVTVSLDFRVTGTETYLFKFYQGLDENGEELYYIVEVPVEEE